MGRSWLAAVIVSGIVSYPLSGVARPADVFQPHLEQIRQELPPTDAIRLPAEILLGGPGHLQPELLIVKVFSSSSPARMTVSLFTCDTATYPCLVGSFSAERATSPNAQRELDRHQATNVVIPLAGGIEGYWLEGNGSTPSSDFSSLIWQQDGMVYTVSFLAAEQENILAMARSMVTEPPIFSLQTASPEP